MFLASYYVHEVSLEYVHSARVDLLLPPKQRRTSGILVIVEMRVTTDNIDSCQIEIDRGVAEGVINILIDVAEFLFMKYVPNGKKPLRDS